ncbi:Plant/protein [Hirschfeldia incana]|nr:Plant/protein [Hirschfeldia incana]
MSLNCLTCHNLQRSDSDIDIVNLKDSKITEKNVTSGYEKMVRNRTMLPAVRRVKMGHRRLYSADSVVYRDLDEPKLARSSGLRRDWSFEDLKKQRDEIKIGETIKE